MIWNDLFKILLLLISSSSLAVRDVSAAHLELKIKSIFDATLALSNCKFPQSKAFQTSTKRNPLIYQHNKCKTPVHYKPSHPYLAADYSLNNMKYSFLSFLLVMFCGSLVAQQRLERKKMVYVQTNKPNSIVYNDTIYRGSVQYRNLFYRTGDIDIIQLYKQHQSNKITGTILGTAGSFALAFGVAQASSKVENKNTGWIVAGAGLVTAITGGYLMVISQQKIATATALFNQRHATASTSAGIGITDNGIGLIVKF